MPVPQCLAPKIKGDVEEGQVRIVPCLVPVQRNSQQP